MTLQIRTARSKIVYIMNVGRPREFNTEDALHAAMHQFWEVGYEATSLQDLMAVMRLSKSSLYQAFGSKHELLLRSLDSYQQFSVSELNKSLRKSSSSKVFLQQFLENVISEASAKEKKGCLLVNTANELAHRDQTVSKAVSKGMGNVANIIRKAIEQGKEEKIIDSTASTDELVSYVMANVSGLRTMVKSGAKKADLVPVVSMIMKTVY